MAAFVQFHEFGRYLGDGTIDLDSDTFRAVLSNVAPTAATDDTLSDITQIANGNGYTTGGVTLGSVTWTETGAGSGIWAFSAADFSWTATGGAMAQFRYIVLYDDTPISPADPLLGYLDYGSGLTLPQDATFTVDIGANGITRLTVS